MQQRRTSCAVETERLGAQLAAELKPGDVVVLHGDLGAGKTTFVRGALRALGITGPVTSPTFTLGRRYEQGTVTVSHLDLHRLHDLVDEDPALLDDYIDGSAITFVEWPDAAGDALRPSAVVELEHAGGDARRVTVRRP